MAKKDEVLTVILPTRDRAETLEYALQTVTSQDSPNIEIIISDNFSGPEVKAVADACDDKRLKYIRTDRVLGMSEHWEFAIGHVTGDWVTIIGDDDGLLPDGADRFFQLTKKHPDIKVITASNCRFQWPSEGQNDGKLSLVSGEGYEIQDGLDVIKRTMYGEIIAMPTIYTGGFIHMDVINEVKSKNPDGKFFQSITPDVYSGMAVCSVAGKYIYSYESLGIAGASKKSNSGQYKNKTSEEMSSLKWHQEGDIAFHSSLNGAAIESMHIMLYESFLQTQCLREDDFGVTMEQQLELALSHCSTRVFEELIKYCRAVAEKNNLNFEEILKRSKAKRSGQKLQRLSLRLKRKFFRGEKLPKKTIDDNNVRTIYDAAKKFGEMI